MRIKSAAIMFAFLMLLLTISFTACGNENESANENVQMTENNDNSEDKAGSDINPIFKDIKIVAEVQGITSIEMRTNEGGIWILGDDSAYYIEYGKDDNTKPKIYTLMIKDKIGVLQFTDKYAENAWKNFEPSTSLQHYLFSFKPNENEGFKKIGSEKIAGRNTTIYTFKILTSENKIWRDDEYDILMKLALIHDEKTEVTFEVKELKVGGNKLSDLINLNDYTIKDLTQLYEENRSVRPQ